MSDPEHIVWDSCVFIRYLTEDPNEFVDDIARYITDARNKRRTIYFSTIAWVEIRPSHLRRGTVEQLFADWGSVFVPIEPNPQILFPSAKIRDCPPINPADGSQSNRVVTAPDAIHLMTAVYVRDVLGVSDVVFHTLDRGRNSTAGQKNVPLIGFERWFPQNTRTLEIQSVCDLARKEPRYPEADLLSEPSNDEPLVPGSGHTAGPSR